MPGKEKWVSVNPVVFITAKAIQDEFYMKQVFKDIGPLIARNTLLEGKEWRVHLTVEYKDNG